MSDRPRTLIPVNAPQSILVPAVDGMASRRPQAVAQCMEGSIGNPVGLISEANCRTIVRTHNGTKLFALGLSFDVLVRRVSQEGAMDKDRVKGSATNMGGKAKEAAGKMTGDTKLQGEGKMDQAKGKVQNAAGGIKDALKK